MEKHHKAKIMTKKKVLVVGAAENSKGGIASAIKVIKSMPVWNKFSCYWLGTQVQENKIIKLYFALKAYITALLIIPHYDIIHFHTVPNISLLVQFPIFLLAKLWKKKIILQIHVGNQIEEEIENKLFQFYIKNSDKIILLAKIWKEKFDTLFSSYNKNSDYIYNAFTPVNCINYKYRTKTIVFAAHFDHNKAYDIMLKAFELVLKKHSDWQLIMMGNGEVEKGILLARELKLGKNVTFTGYITGEKKEKYFQEASIYCMCSYREGFPMTVLEAWGYGIPVITTPVGGLPDVIEEKKNAIVFKFGDYHDLANKIDYLISNRELRNYMSDYSQNFVSKIFSHEEISRKIEEIYSNI